MVAAFISILVLSGCGKSVVLQDDMSGYVNGMTSKYQENLFMRTMNGNDLVDNAYRMLKSA